MPASSLIVWFCIDNIFGFVDALVWSGPDFAQQWDGKGFCDLNVRISSGTSLGQMCATTCIIFNLYMILAARNHGFLAAHSKSRLWINIAMCWINPLILMGVSVIVQTNRYNVVRYRGCTATYKATVGSVLLYSGWNLIWIALACVFAILTIYEFVRKRKDILDLLRCTNLGLSMRRFARLILLSFLILLVLSPVVLVSFVADITTAINITPEQQMEYALIKWSDIYAMDLGKSYFSSRIVEIVFLFCAFLLFGLGVDALEMYRNFFVWLGFKSLQRRPAEEVQEFKGSRSSSKQTECSETTIGFTPDEFEDIERLVLQKEPYLPASSDIRTFGDSELDLIEKM